MNKKLITLAVAAAMTAPAAAMAEATLYGTLHQSIDYIDQDDVSETVVVNGDTYNLTGQGWSGWSVSRTDGGLPGGETVTVTDAAGNVVDPATVQGLEDLVTRLQRTNNPPGPANRIGVKGSEDLGGGLKGIYQVEFGVRLADGDFSAANGDRGSISMRNSFVGLAGSFGTFLVGRHDTPLKISTGKLDLFADTIADYNGPLGFNDVRADNAIAYISPNFSGFQLAGAVHAGGGATVEGVPSIEADSLAEAWSVAGIYSNGPFYGSVAYEVLSEDMTAGVLTDADAVDDYTKWRFGLGILDWNGFTLAGVYEDRNNTLFVNDDDSSSWEVLAGYAFGNNMIKAAYGSVDRDVEVNDIGNFGDLGDAIDDALNGDLTQWTVAFDHNFSKRTKAYALYTQVDDDTAPDWDAFSLGVVHKF